MTEGLSPFCRECGEALSAGIEAHPGHVTIHLFDPHEASALLDLFPDGELEAAIERAWPA